MAKIIDINEPDILNNVPFTLEKKADGYIPEDSVFIPSIKDAARLAAFNEIDFEFSKCLRWLKDSAETNKAQEKLVWWYTQALLFFYEHYLLTLKNIPKTAFPTFEKALQEKKEKTGLPF